MSSTPPIVRLARVPARIPAVDLGIAAALLAWAVLEALLAAGPGSPAARVLLAAGFTLPLAVRRRWPVPVLLAIAALGILRGTIGGPDEEGAMPFPALLLAGFSAALYARPRWLSYGAAPVPILALALAGYGSLDYPPGVFLSLAAWTAGFLIRRRAEQLAAARARAPELAREAVAAERARIAGELHDVVAHAVTFMSVQAGAAEALLEREPGKARTHVEAVRRSAREALVELRRLVGVLREGEEPERPPAPAGGQAVVELARVPRGVPRVDLAIAAGMLAWALSEALVLAKPGPRWAAVALAVGATLPLIVRRRWAVPVLAAVCLLMVVPDVALDGRREGAMPFPVLLLATFSAALYGRPRALAAAALPAAVLAAAGAVLAGDTASPAAVDIPILCALTGGAWTAGWLIRRRAEQIDEARARGPVLAREAVSSERARLARELHDVVGHAVTLISVQAGAAEVVIEREPERARPHLEAVRHGALVGVVEMRRLVGALRDDEAPYSPQPGLERLGDLLAEARAAGLPVELCEEGERGWVPAGVDLAAYRIAQESLTNVRRHAGLTPTRVRVRYGEAALELEIANAAGRRNGAVGPGGGQGLIGMRERVRVYGGALETGPAPGGGFTVRASLPLEGPPA